MASNSSKQWTPEEDKRLLELEAAGKSRVLIAAAASEDGQIDPFAPVSFEAEANKGSRACRRLPRWKIVS
jgi:hypothetical protein